jgi:endonuclease-3
LTEDDGRVRLADLRGMPRAEAVASLTQLPGVGRKTAACVLLFGSHVPAIPVDTHVHRVALRLGLVAPRTGPDATEDALEAALEPRDYYAFHVNMIRLGREVCKAPRPRCGVCPLRARCAFFSVLLST